MASNDPRRDDRVKSFVEKDTPGYYDYTVRALLGFQLSVRNIQNYTDFQISNDKDRRTQILMYLRKCNDSREFKTDPTIIINLDMLLGGQNVKEMPHVFATAVSRNSLGVCRHLLQKGADVNDCLATSESALHCALRLDSFKKTELILSHKPKHVRYESLSPLEFAIANRCDRRILEMLNEHVHMNEVEEAIQKVGFVVESPLECSRRLGVLSWERYFIEQSLFRPTRAHVNIPSNVGHSSVTSYRRLGVLSRIYFSIKSLFGPRRDCTQEYYKKCLLSAPFDEIGRSEVRPGSPEHFMPALCTPFDEIGRSMVLQDSPELSAPFDEIGRSEVRPGSQELSEDTKRALVQEEIESYRKKRRLNKTVEFVRNCGNQFEEKLTDVNYVIQSLFQLLEVTSRESPDFYDFKFKPVLVGSSAGETGCFFRDGFDFICWLNETEDFDIYKTDDGLFRVKVPEDHRWKHFCCENIIEQRKLLSAFNKSLKIALPFIRRKIKRGIVFPAKELMSINGIPCLPVLWRSERYGDISVLVNIYPAFRLPAALTETLPGAQHYIVPQKDKLEHEDRVLDFTLSCSSLEKGLIEDMPRNIKQAFNYAKAMRFTDVCLYPSKTDLSAFGLEETVYTEHLLSTHMLLSCLLSIIPKNAKFIDKICPEAWARDIYIAFAESLGDRNMEIFEVPAYLLCRKECIGESGCCRKRNLTLALANNIITSLNQTFSFMPSQIPGIPVVRPRNYRHKMENKAISWKDPEQDNDSENEDSTTKANRRSKKKKPKRILALEKTNARANSETSGPGTTKSAIGAEMGVNSYERNSKSIGKIASDLAKLDLKEDRDSYVSVCAGETGLVELKEQNDENTESDQEASLTLDDINNINVNHGDVEIENPGTLLSRIHQRSIVLVSSQITTPVVSISTAESGDTSDRSTDFFQSRDMPSADEPDF